MGICGLDGCAISGFDWGDLDIVRGLYPQASIWYQAAASSTAIADLASRKPAVLQSVHTSWTPALVAEAHRAGIGTSIRDHLTQALAELRASHAAQDRAIKGLETALETTLQEGFNALPAPSAPVSEHLRAHRPGKPPKIASDPELQTFIVARVDRLTFHQIAAEVAQHFHPARRVGKPAIHAWWQSHHSDTSAGA